MLRGRDRASAVASFKPPGRDETAREKAGWRVRHNGIYVTFSVRK